MLERDARLRARFSKAIMLKKTSAAEQSLGSLFVT